MANRREFSRQELLKLLGHDIGLPYYKLRKTLSTSPPDQTKDDLIATFIVELLEFHTTDILRDRLIANGVMGKLRAYADRHEAKVEKVAVAYEIKPEAVRQGRAISDEVMSVITTELRRKQHDTNSLCRVTKLNFDSVVFPAVQALVDAGVIVPKRVPAKRKNEFKWVFVPADRAEKPAKKARPVTAEDRVLARPKAVPGPPAPLVLAWFSWFAASQRADAIDSYAELDRFMFSRFFAPAPKAKRFAQVPGDFQVLHHVPTKIGVRAKCGSYLLLRPDRPVKSLTLPEDYTEFHVPDEFRENLKAGSKVPTTDQMRAWAAEWLRTGRDFEAMLDDFDLWMIGRCGGIADLASVFSSSYWSPDGEVGVDFQHSKITFQKITPSPFEN